MVEISNKYQKFDEITIIAHSFFAHVLGYRPFETD